MAKGYWIARVDIKDEEPAKRYAAGNFSIYAKFGGRYLVRSQKFDVPEGSCRSRQIVVEFPDYASAQACYHSPETQRTEQGLFGCNPMLDPRFPWGEIERPIALRTGASAAI
jgi:uncharacterized protein (DUF1330 family)